MGLLDLFRPKWKHSDPKVRKAAVEKLIDQTVLAEIVKYDENGDVLRTAWEKLTDQNVLTDIAKNAMYHNVRLAAVGKLTDQIVLTEIAKNEENKWVRRDAVEKLTDQAFLADIAKNDKEESVRYAAINNPNFTDQSLLAEMAKNDNDEYVSLGAMQNPNLTNQDILADIAWNAKNEYIREFAVNFLDHLDHDILIDLAKQGCNAAKKRIYELSPEAEVDRKRMSKALEIHNGESLYIFALINKIGERGESFAQQICDCVYGQGGNRAGMWKFAGVNEISVNHALRLKNDLGISWGAPENTWEGVLPSGEKVAALFWKT